MLFRLESSTLKPEKAISVRSALLSALTLEVAEGTPL
ncbi:hypothetical protein ALP92_01976 [Pseudomonas syringae pv. primulae]|uniref:Uncharacterized protein n=1 Tax=Pseudomonas syringae pv. primulae TaxID=251707 RepID=A0A3M4SI66_9PSED|nr:hypothetical protein ALP92_01976 [Pseudomonas syringae pv. primulae]